MEIDFLNNLATQILAISLATERLISILKTFIKWLYENHPDETKEKFRRITVVVLSLTSAWLTAGFLSQGGTYDLFGKVNFGENHSLPVPLVAFLASGGSSLWNNILGYTKAVKDSRKESLRGLKVATGPN